MGRMAVKRMDNIGIVVDDLTASDEASAFTGAALRVDGGIIRSIP